MLYQRACLIALLAIFAGNASAFTVAPRARAGLSMARRMATEEPAAEAAAPAPAAEGEVAAEEEAEPVPEPEPELPKMSVALPFMPRPEALDLTMVGDKGFDPFGFSSSYDLRWLREAELKHCRVAMLAVVGWIATDWGLHLPGDVHNVGTVAAHDAAVKSGAMSQLLLWIGIAEVWSAIAIKEMMLEESDRMPGDYALDISGGFKRASAEDKESLQLKELNNGRLAMIAFGGIVTQAVLTGETFPFF